MAFLGMAVVAGPSVKGGEDKKLDHHPQLVFKVKGLT
jgi:hypothetical protein